MGYSEHVTKIFSLDVQFRRGAGRLHSDEEEHASINKLSLNNVNLLVSLEDWWPLFKRDENASMTFTGRHLLWWGGF